MSLTFIYLYVQNFDECYESFTQSYVAFTVQNIHVSISENLRNVNSFFMRLSLS